MINIVQLIPKEEIRKEIDKIKEGTKPASALDIFKAQVAGSIATKSQKENYFNNLGKKKQEELSAIVYADEEKQKEQLAINKATLSAVESIKKNTSAVLNALAGDAKPNKNIIELGKDASKIIDSTLTKYVPMINGYRVAATAPTVGERDNIVLNFLSQIPITANKINENIAPYLQGSKKAEWEAYYNKYNKLSLDVSAYVKKNKQKEKIYQDAKTAKENNNVYSGNITNAVKNYIEKRENQDKKLFTYQANLFNSVSWG